MPCLGVDDASEVSDIDNDEEKLEPKKFSPTVPVAFPHPPSMSPLVGDYLVNRHAAVDDMLRHGAHESLPTIPPVSVHADLWPTIVNLFSRNGHRS